SPNAKLVTACPLDFDHQHVYREDARSTELAPKPLDARHGARRLIQWQPRAGVGKGPFQVRYEFYCSVDVRRPTTAMTKPAQALSAAPPAGEYVKAEPRVESDDAAVSTLALDVTRGLEKNADQARALFQYVDREIAGEPGAGGPGLSAAECLRARRGDAA